MLKVCAVHIINVIIVGAKILPISTKTHFTWCENMLKYVEHGDKPSE